MRSDRRPTAVLLFVLSVLAGSVLPARSCGPDLLEATLVRRSDPDDIEAFAAGKIGVILPTYYQRYLYLAYRNLTGHPLSAEDRLAAISFPPSTFGEDQQGFGRWRTLRDSLLSEKKREYVQVACARQVGNDYYYYPNYYDDAFRTAAATLTDRVRRQGGVDRSVRDWILAQDEVFYACGQDSSPPGAAPAGSPEWLVKDRAYQGAAWDFYAGNFDGAAERFRAIGADAASPWHDIAPYLVARSLVRKGMVTPGYRNPDKPALAVAEREIERLLADPKQTPLHAAEQRLLEFVRLRLYPEQRLGQLGRSLLAARPGADLSQQVFDLTVLLDRVTVAQVESLSATSPDFELADWILSFQLQHFEHAVARWHAAKNAPWLVAAITSASSDKPEVPEILAAAAKVGPKDPAFASVAFHRARLLTDTGKSDEARAVLGALSLDAFPNSSWNLVQALRLRLARDYEEFLAHAPRLPSMFSGYDYSGDASTSSLANPKEPVLDVDAAYILNRWAPLTSAARAAASPKQGKGIRDRLALAIWTRAAMLDDNMIAARLSGPVATTYPALASYLKSYAAAADAPSRRFEAVWMFLHTPGMSPWVRWGVGRLAPITERDLFRDNWWSAARPNESAWFLGERDPQSRVPEVWTNPLGWDTKTAATIFSPDERGRAERERSTLSRLGPGPNFMSEQTMAWAESHPRDPRLAEALHLCVQATRYGYIDAQTTQWSRRAFSLLHSRYPNSEWAKKTKYWY